MTSRERVLRTLTFEGPDRMPMARGEDADFAFVGYRPAHGFAPKKPGMDEWGCVWRPLKPSAGDQGQVSEHPLSDWRSVRDFHFPDPFAPDRLDGAREGIDSLHHDGKFVCASLGKGPIHLLDDLRGFEAYLMDLVSEPERIELLLDGIFGFLVGMVEQFGALGVDAMLLSDDQAMQSGPLFSMDIWRERFRPRYRELFALAHEAGCKVYLHTCGNLSQHLTELVDVGVDLIDNKQPALWMHAPGVDAVRGRVSFSTCLDIQSVMGSIEMDKIDAAVSALIRRLSVPEGGFVATYYDQPDLQIPPEKTARMVEAFRAFRWP